MKSVILEVSDVAAATAFYRAFGVDAHIELRASEAPTSGFRGFAMSLVVSQPGNVDALISAALDGGATTLKPARKSFWGYGGVVRAPDGTIWKIATSSKKDTEPAGRRIDDVVLLLGVASVKASKRFYVDNGLAVGKSFGGKYVDFTAPADEVKLALYPRHALAKDVGVEIDGTGSHRIVLRGDGGSFTDPDGYVWQAVPAAQPMGL